MDVKVNNRKLSSTEPKIRQKALENLQTHILALSPVEYKKVAYGLFYYYWHSDGYQNQEEDADAIANLLDGLTNKKFILLAKALFLGLRRLWAKIDYHRTAKYLSLLNVLLKKVYAVLKSKNKVRLYELWNDFLFESILMEDKGELTSQGDRLSDSVCVQRDLLRVQGKQHKGLSGFL